MNTFYQLIYKKNSVFKLERMQEYVNTINELNQRINEYVLADCYSSCSNMDKKKNSEVERQNQILSGLNLEYEIKLEKLSTFDKIQKISIQMLINSPILNTKTKFNFLDSVRNNVFFDNELRENIYKLFYDCQRKYHLLNRLVYRYKFKKTPIFIKNDLFLNTIQESQHNVLTIIQNEQKYLFTFLDLKNIIESALSHSPFHFSCPLPIKNPYNNMPFEKSILYNIYFFMKRGDFVIPTLFHHYFLSNFHLKNFQDENEVIIQNSHFKQYFRNATTLELWIEIKQMLKRNCLTKRLSIHRDFPIEKLVEIFKPYLELYYREVFSFDINIKEIARLQLLSKLKKFYEYNPKFGRKNIKKVTNFVLNTTTKVIIFNEEYPPFYVKKRTDDSHLVISENDYNIYYNFDHHLSTDDDSDRDSP
jgi:hypothetical protein